MTKSTEAKVQALVKLVETVHRLRAPGGCPWDRAQTHQTLRPFLIEEAYEVLDALDKIQTKEDLKNDAIRSAFREEMGDLLMQVLLHSEMANEEGAFDFYDVAATLDEKLIRRHPHVFGDAKADTADSAYLSWEKQKAKEKASNPEASLLDGLPKGLPALQRAGKVIEKVSKVGFQWPDMNGPLDKVAEELGELKTEVLAYEKNKDEATREKVASELGDLFFSLANIAHHMKITPEDALRSQLARFESRFRHVEKGLKARGKTPSESNLEEMDGLWNEAKALERAKK